MSANTFTVDRRILELAREQLLIQLAQIDRLLGVDKKPVGRPRKDAGTQDGLGVWGTPAGRETRLPAILSKRGMKALPEVEVEEPKPKRSMTPKMLKAMKRNAAIARAAWRKRVAAAKAKGEKIPYKRKEPAD